MVVVRLGVCWLLLTALDLMKEKDKLRSANCQLRVCHQRQKASMTAFKVTFTPVARGQMGFKTRHVITLKVRKL